MDLSNLKYYYPPEGDTNLTVKRDLIVYGATPAGITAAIQAAKMGLTVAIAEFGKHVGGITASGLGATDAGVKDAIGGLSREFYRRIGKHYGKEEQWTFEPHVAEKVFLDWLKEYDIPVYFTQHLKAVIKNDGAIEEIVMENGNRFIGEYFIDASYEGDLLARAGVSYTVGREANSVYKEIYNGIQFSSPHHNFDIWIDPYIVEGKPESGLLPGIMDVDESEIGYPGKGDKCIQAYNFRICLTKEKDNQVPFYKPPGYDSTQYLLLLRYINAGFWNAMNLHTKLPNGKTDLNNFGGFSTDYIGANHSWPDGSYEEREKIFQEHVRYDLGMLYFLANDRRVPKEIREEVSEWGLAKDEFIETGHFPHQLYIREARRMISDYVMTDQNCLGYRTVEDSIGLASYQMDSHHCRRLVVGGRVMNEGDGQSPVSPFPISYRSIRPFKEECINLLVPVAVSASHIAFGSIRMEPVFMILGQTAGAAASLALKSKGAVQDVKYDELKQVLETHEQVLEWDDSIEDDPVKRMYETFGKTTKKVKFN